MNTFLLRHFQYRKSMNPSFSFALWARRLKVKSPAMLCMMTKGQRKPGRDLIEKLKFEMGLNDEEARYFEVLVDLTKHKSEVVPSLVLMRELEKAHPNKGFKLVDHDSFRSISNWYYWALLEMVSLKSFQEDPAWITAKLEFEVPVDDIREALVVLQRMKLVERDKKNRLRRSTLPLITESDTKTESTLKFHYQTLENAKKSVHQHTMFERELQGVTLPITAAQLPQAKKFIREFVSDFCRRFDNQDAQKVYQLELALFPLTKNLKENL